MKGRKDQPECEKNQSSVTEFQKASSEGMGERLQAEPQISAYSLYTCSQCAITTTVVYGLPSEL